MRLSIFALTQRQPDWVDAGVADYAKRFGRDFPLELIDLKPESRQSGRPVDRLLKAEAARCLEALQRKAPKARLVVLDERGQDWTTATLSRWLAERANDSPQIAFVIGSADGLDETVKSRADVSLRLSSMTLPHGLAKLLLVEQLYRAVSMLNHHPYHRDA